MTGGIYPVTEHSEFKLEYQVLGGGTLAVAIRLHPECDPLEYAVTTCSTYRAIFDLNVITPQLVPKEQASALLATSWPFSALPNTLISIVKYQRQTSIREKALMYHCSSNHVRLYHAHQWSNPPEPIKLKSRYASPS